MIKLINVRPSKIDSDSEEAKTLFRRFATRYFPRFGSKGAKDSHNLKENGSIPCYLSSDIS